MSNNTEAAFLTAMAEHEHVQALALDGRRLTATATPATSSPSSSGVDGRQTQARRLPPLPHVPADGVAVVLSVVIAVTSRIAERPAAWPERL